MQPGNHEGRKGMEIAVPVGTVLESISIALETWKSRGSLRLVS